MRWKYTTGVIVALVISLTGVPGLPAAAATAVAGPRLTGAFTATQVVTASSNAPEPVGFRSTAKYTFSPACPAGPCRTTLIRTRRDGTTASYALTPDTNGGYTGVGDYLSACIMSSGAVVSRLAYATHEELTVRPTADSHGVVTTFAGTLSLSFTPAAGAPAGCPASAETLAVDGSLPAQPPVFTKYPTGLVYPNSLGSARFAVWAADPGGQAVTISWSALPTVPVFVSCRDETGPATTALVACTVTGRPGAAYRISTITFIATDELGLTTTRRVTVGPPSYVGMGDSYASGEGSPPFEPGTDRTGDFCHRSTKAGARLFALAPAARQSPLAMRFVACSGARTRDLAGLFNGETSQYEVLGSTVTLASVSIGGNDVGFASVVKTCVIAFEPDGGSCQRTAEPAARKALAALDVPNATTGLTPLQTVYKRIQLNMAPGGHLLVVGYPRLFGSGHGQKTPRGCEGVNTKDTKWINKLLDDGNAVIRRNAEAVHATYVDLSAAFLGHGLCDTRANWINGIRLTSTHGIKAASTESFHPNAVGQGIIAAALRKAYGSL